jgi:hypothetical protein
MKNIKQLGIWLDHSIAYLMVLTNGSILTSSVVAESSKSDAEINLFKGEKLIHKKEQHLQLNFYKKISEALKNYEKVLLFGPTDAKNELLNLVKTDHHFDSIKIEVRNSDKMTEIQMKTYVKEYFK